MSPDECVAELTKLATHYEKAVASWTRSGFPTDDGISAKYKRRAEAIRWILALNAYGVAEHEVVL